MNKIEWKKFLLSSQMAMLIIVVMVLILSDMYGRNVTDTIRLPKSLQKQEGKSTAWQSSSDPSRRCHPASFIGAYPNEENGFIPQHVFTWQRQPPFFLIGNSRHDYITSLARPETPFFEFHVSEWLVEILDQAREDRGRGKAQASEEQFVQHHPVWFFDIGANIGVHTLHVAATGYPVVAIEGFPPTGAHLACNKKINNFDHLYVIPEAISSKEQDLCFSVPLFNNIGASNAAKDYTECNPAFLSHARPLDSMLYDVEKNIPVQKLGPPAIMKIDIEGFEYEAFVSLAKHLANPEWRPNIIFAELYPQFLTAKGSSFQQIGKLIIGYGYDMYSADLSIKYNQQVLALGPNEEIDQQPCHNYLFVKVNTKLPPPNKKLCFEYDSE